jgi:ketosteroid isomerase-like protein
MKKLILMLVLLSSVTAASFAQMAPAKLGDWALVAVGKQSLDAMSKGDMDSYMANFADNAVYTWNNGDSLAGKQAIAAYWKDRRANVIQSITFSNEIWLPVVTLKAQANEQTGNWLLGWYQTMATYKTGKSMTQAMQVDMHFNAAGKIDHVYSYLDRVPINAAMAK